MESKIKQVNEAIHSFSPKNFDDLERFRISYLGSKGLLKELFEDFKTLSGDNKRVWGKALNELKQLAEAKYSQLKETFVNEPTKLASQLDLTLPGQGMELGSRHPLSLVRKEIVEIFKKLGFGVEEGPEIDDDWHNFTALNFPPEHPARDMQDTFFIETKEKAGNQLLRTHTSNVQVRLMQTKKPPLRAIMPGRVYRNEAISARTHCFFHQVEGLCIDESCSFADLKQTLFYFVQDLFGQKTKVRFRPSYFPFTEPSAEMDISCTICASKGCPLCKHSGWVEILGCGMVDPNVLDNCGIDHKTYTGYAFGMGIERITNLKYRIKDLRLFSQNDVRFLKQFQAELL